MATEKHAGLHSASAGELVAAESNPKQQGLFDEKPVLRSITKDK
jgi:hypothetical protein